MSKHKSDLLKRFPIASTGELLADAGKYNLADVTFHREVTEFEISEDARTLEMTLSPCGHHRVIRKRKGRWWADEVPGTWTCEVCREDRAFFVAEEKRKLEMARRKRR